ncbi:hypothetical protein ABR737_01615 [Streptomyces sp. Edi2]|uniref:hypothetical protein n=1 Tax=Streptomyces sp. Edi2 TaxID=3162528 RepID=UPI0033068041
MNTDSELIPHVEMVRTSPWLGKTATGPRGRTGTVRQVYDVEGVHVAVLTADDADIYNRPIWNEPVDLLATGTSPAAVPDFSDRLSEFTRLEVTLVRGSPSEAENERFGALRESLSPYLAAGPRLRRALIEQVQPGDRVVASQNWRATVLDPDLEPQLPLRTRMRVRVDARHVQADPMMRERYADGVIDLAPSILVPTLGLI